jgi:hypothetical protein
MKTTDKYLKLSPAEKSFHDALIGVVKKHGKFGGPSADGVYPNYQSPSENEDVKIGVKCGNCSFYEGEGKCQIVAQKVESNGICRLAAIPDGYVKGY